MHRNSKCARGGTKKLDHGVRNRLVAPCLSAGLRTRFRTLVVVRIGQRASCDLHGANADCPVQRTGRVEVLLGAILERDRELGLRGDGPAVAALEAAATEGMAPIVGKALFSVTLEHGRVSITVVDASSEREAWESVARVAQNALKGRPIRMLGGNCLRFEIELTSDKQLPSGTNPGVDVGIAGITVKKGEGPRSTKVGILEPSPRGLTLLRLEGDSADIGASARRVVHARVVREIFL